jgi:predicted transcriptional regulator
MAAPTTIKLPEELKERIAPLAEATGVTPHAWMIEALQRQASLAEARANFIAEAASAAREVDAGGPLYAAEDVFTYILARASGRKVARPKPVKRPPDGARKYTARNRTRRT